MVICALLMNQGTSEQPADGLWSITALECPWDTLCKGHGVPQDILKPSSGPLFQRFSGSSDVTCCYPQQLFSEVEVEGCTVRTARFAVQSVSQDCSDGSTVFLVLHMGLTDLSKISAI